MEDAEKMLRDAVDQLTGLMQSGQADRETASRLAACNVSLGYVLAIRRHAGAEEQIQRSIDIFEYLSKESTVSLADRITHGQALTNLGRLYLDLGEFDTAVATLTKSTEHFEAIVDEDPTTHGQHAASLAKLALAEALQAINDDNAAKRHHQSALDVLASLAEAEPAEHQVRRDSATMSLIISLLESIDSQHNVQRASQLLSDLKITSTSAAHLLQLQAIARYRSGSPLAKTSIENAMAGRRFPAPVDRAVLGCIIAGQDKAAAQAALDSALKSLTQTPGDLRLRLWTSELSNLLQPAESSAHESQP
jgi:tetratricopeptide (TPR) repeat protein